jgi:ABC-type branched-subunit amino acid transport system ATPase component
VKLAARSSRAGRRAHRAPRRRLRAAGQGPLRRDVGRAQPRARRLKRRTGAGLSWDEERILAAFPRLKERWRSPADYLSGGEQQMLAVARALRGDTRLLSLDEPFEGLAPAVVEELFESFHKLRGEVSIIIVDHHLDLVLALSDRTVALERGQVTHIGPSSSWRQIGI